MCWTHENLLSFHFGWSSTVTMHLGRSEIACTVYWNVCLSQIKQSSWINRWSLIIYYQNDWDETAQLRSKSKKKILMATYLVKIVITKKKQLKFYLFFSTTVPPYINVKHAFFMPTDNVGAVLVIWLVYLCGWTQKYIYISVAGCAFHTWAFSEVLHSPTRINPPLNTIIMMPWL